MFERLKHLVYFGLLGLVIFLFGYIRGCKRDNATRNSERSTSEEVKGPTRIVEGARPISQGASGNLSRSNQPTNRRTTDENIPYVPPEGYTTIESRVPGKSVEDLIRIRRHEFGIFPGEFGIQTSFLRPSIGLDTKVVFLGRWGLNVGVLGSSHFDYYISPTASISYRLDRLPHIHNTELWVGFVPLSRYTIQTGLRINL